MHFLLTLAFVCLHLYSHAQVTVCSYDFSTGLNGWTPFDVSDATDVFTATSGYIEMNGFGGQDDEDWFVSPSINMDNQDQEYLLFDYNDGFNGNLIELYYSTNFNGGSTVSDLQTASWQIIPLDLIDINNTTCFSTLFQHHRAIDISGISGASVHFAFKYTGTSSNSKRYRLDNFHIEAMYYGNVQQQINTGLRCDSLKTAIHTLIQYQTRVVEYTSSNYDVWDALLVTDMRLNDAGTSLIVWDMFTDRPNQTGEFEFDHCSDRDNGSCPNTEGVCYNREHTFPRSWWGGGTTYTTDTINFDLHHLTPSDKEMNFRKFNYPPGVVTSPNITGSNGFKVGTNSSYPCSSMQYFEPIDEYKGDYARMFFYIATRYESQIASWFGSNSNGDCALTGSAFPGYATWMINVLLDWHAQDSVSQKEIDRNNSVYAIQGNRNPFVDNPLWVYMIWGDNAGTPCDQIQNGCTPVSSNDVQVACGSYTWIDGVTYTTSNNSATTTLTNAAGCDSIVSLDLTILQPSTSTDVQTACVSYTWIDGVTYTASNNSASVTLTNAIGCDSIVSLDLTILQPSSFTDVQTACGSYTWIDGVTYTVSNNSATTTLTNAAGCDSTVSLDLTILQPSSFTDVQTACGSYTWIDGVTYTASNNSASVTLTNATGCDSIISLDLTLSQATSYTDVQSACTPYTWIDGVTYTSSNNTATVTLTNSAGCDSIVSLDLTISSTINITDNQFSCGPFIWIDGNTYASSTNSPFVTYTSSTGCDSTITLSLIVGQASSYTDVQTACGSYTWIDGNTYTASNNTATVTLTNASGCDSIVSLDLTILQASSSTDVQTACGSYTWIDGNTYTASNNTATVTLTNASGCDSIVSLDLSVTTIDTSVSLSGAILQANQSGAIYQWIDCQSGLLVGNSQSFTPASNGQFAVIVTLNACTDTSSCVSYNVSSIEHHDVGHNKTISIVPNPGQNYFRIRGIDQNDIDFIELSNMNGIVLKHSDRSVFQTKDRMEVGDLPQGIYIIRIVDKSGESYVFKWLTIH